MFLLDQKYLRQALVDEHETDRFFLPADKKAEMSILALELLS